MIDENKQEQMSSVTLSRNAKGGVQPEVKVYHLDPAFAKDAAVRIFDELVALYPHEK